MNSQKNNMTGGGWEVLKNIPGIRYLKEPVDTVSQLYERYSDGVERGTLAYILEHNCFYAFNIAERIWIPVGTEIDVFNSIKELIDSETAARQDADAALQKAVAAESAGRQAVDSSLYNSVGIYNITQRLPLSSGYYTAATARAAVPAEIRKKGLIITYQTDANTWQTEQAKSISNWLDDNNWTKIITETDFLVHTDNERVHIQYKGDNPNLDNITDIGYYFYSRSVVGSSVSLNYYLQVIGSRQTGLTQIRYSGYGIEIREGDGHGSEWGKWEKTVGSGEMEAVKKKLTEIEETLVIVEKKYAYGIEFDTSIPSSACTRIGNMELHRILPVQSKMKGCLLDDNGHVVEYLQPDSWETHDRSGSSGQVMVEIPAHYRKFETEGTRRRVKISELQLPGYHFVPKKYISAYEAAINRNSGKLASVVNTSTDYRGGNNQANWDNTHFSLLGRPATSKSRTQFRAAARLRGAGTQWNCNDYGAYKDVFWLYCIEYANRNSQLPFNAQPDANGCRQGGLGNGTTTMSTGEWSLFNSQLPFIPCGHTDQKGNASGEVAYLVDVDGDGSIVRTVYANRYRGIENPFGHIWKWTDGINIDVKTNDDGGMSQVYICNDPSKYTDNDYQGYEPRGLAARTEGYIKEILFGEFGEIIASATGATSTSFWCDFHYTGIASSSLFGVRFGGYASLGTYGGFTCAHLGNIPSFSQTNVGTRLCFIPEKSDGTDAGEITFPEYNNVGTAVEDFLLEAEFTLKATAI
jgi:hypothetical protein